MTGVVAIIEWSCGGRCRGVPVPAREGSPQASRHRLLLIATVVGTVLWGDILRHPLCLAEVVQRITVELIVAVCMLEKIRLASISH